MTGYVNDPKSPLPMLESIRKNLADVFDLHPKKSRISRVLDKVIYAIILISTIGVIMETQASMQKYLFFLEEIEWIIISFFLVELVLQISVLRTLFSRHPSTQERLTILFYLAIDIVAVLPPVILFFNLHHHFDYFLSLRLIRIFKVFRHDHSVEFIVRAIMKKRTELLKSIALTMIFTVFLSVVLFEVENNLGANHTSNFTDIMTSLWWSLDVYMDEVSGYVGDEFRPITSAGMFIAGLMGFMKIAIVVIPTGIIASGFIEVIEEDKINDKYDLLQHAYRKKMNNRLGVMLYEQPHSLITVKNALNFSDQDIYKILEARDGFRMRSIMSSNSERYSDINIIEYFGYGMLTPYGTKSVEPHHELLFVCPNNFEEKGMGYFTYCLASVFNAGLITNEKYRINSLNPDFDFDYVHTEAYFQMTPNKLAKQDIKKLSKCEKAFYCFISNLATAVSGKKILLMKSDHSEKSVRIRQLTQDDKNLTSIEKWLVPQSVDVFVVAINPHVLNEDREYNLVLKVRGEIESVIGESMKADLAAQYSARP
jgi:voltage-gated potassium channel